MKVLSGPLTVLVADDEWAEREFLSVVLDNDGNKVLMAEDGIQAMDLLQSRGESIDVILSDVDMPNMDGLELAEYNYKNNNLPLIVLTNNRFAKKALPFIDFGVQDYVVKPAQPLLLLSILKAAYLRRKNSSGQGAISVGLSGNLSSMEFDSSELGIKTASAWIWKKTKGTVSPQAMTIFSSNVYEFLLNSHEHGNLRIKEEEKGELITNGKYFEELAKREAECKARISVGISIVQKEVGISISDEGDGFYHELYTNMPENEMLKRLTMPNGRGIIMAKNYFDSIVYENRGSTVRLTKNF